MNKRLVASLLFSFLLFGYFNLSALMYTSLHPIQVKAEDPPYAKWGLIAMQKVKEKYPNADIIDYLHIGREKGTETSTEKFKLWLQENDKEFGVFIDITFHNKTEQIMNITLRETTREIIEGNKQFIKRSKGC